MADEKIKDIKNDKSETKKEKKKMGLSTKIFIALITGAIAGVLTGRRLPGKRQSMLLNLQSFLERLSQIQLRRTLR